MTRSPDAPTRPPVLRLLGTVLVPCVALLSLGCAPYNTGRLDQAIGQATPDDIRQGLGPPQAVRPQSTGETEWVYFDRGSATVGYAGDARSSYCLELVLTFDRQEILRSWRKQACQPAPMDLPAPPR